MHFISKIRVPTSPSGLRYLGGLNPNQTFGNSLQKRTESAKLHFCLGSNNAGKVPQNLFVSLDPCSLQLFRVRDHFIRPKFFCSLLYRNRLCFDTEGLQFVILLHVTCRRLNRMSRCRCRDAINNYRVAQLWTISRDFFKSNFFLMPSFCKDFKLLSIVLIKYQQSNLPCLQEICNH